MADNETPQNISVPLVTVARKQPEPPVTPIGMGKSTRGVELVSVNDLDEAQVASWMTQAATMPFFSAANKKR